MIFGFLNEELFLDKKSGDRKRQQAAVDRATQQPTRAVEQQRNEMIIPTTQNMYNNYLNAAGTAQADYGDIMGRYRSTLDNMQDERYGPVSADTVSYSRTPELEHALKGYGEFADTGGYNAQNIRDMRARGVAPIRAAYGNAQNEMARRINLQGGYSPNANVMRNKMARESGQMMSDAAVNVNAGLAEAQNRGRLAGLQGLGGLSVQDLEMSQRAALANQGAKLTAAGINASPYSPTNQKLAGLAGMANLYSATPGQAQTFGNQLLGSTQNWSTNLGQEQDIGRTGIAGQTSVANIPTGFQAALKNAQTISNIGANVAGAWSGMGNPEELLGSVADPSRNRPPGYR